MSTATQCAAAHDAPARRRLVVAQSDLIWRPVDWRFRACLSFIQRRFPDVQSHDDVGEHAWRFVRRLGRAKSNAESQTIPRLVRRLRPRPLRAAYRIFKKRGLRKCEIQARILADQSPGDIAQVMGIDQSAVETYEVLFFDVRDRLRNRDFISGQVLNVAEECDPHETGRVWAFFAYHGGPIVLQTLIDDLRSRGEGDYRYFLQPRHDAKCTPQRRKLNLAILRLLVPRNKLVALEAIRTRKRLAREEYMDELSKWPKVPLKTIIAGRLLALAKADKTAATAAA